MITKLFLCLDKKIILVSGVKTNKIILVSGVKTNKIILVSCVKTIKIILLIGFMKKNIIHLPSSRSFLCLVSRQTR